VAGNGELLLTGSGAVTVPGITVVGTGAEVLTATGAVIVQDPSVSGAGLHSVAVTGVGDISVPGTETSGTGSTDGGAAPEPPPGVSISGVRRPLRINRAAAAEQAEDELLILL
jgi:hypothetical protein